MKLNNIIFGLVKKICVILKTFAIKKYLHILNLYNNKDLIYIDYLFNVYFIKILIFYLLHFNFYID